MISFGRLLLIPLLVYYISVDRLAAAGWLLGIIGGTDWIDGYLARRLNQTSKVGEFLDPLADRIAVFVAVIGGWIAGGLVPWFAAAIVVREVLIGIGALVIGLSVGSKLEVRFIGKVATASLYAAIAWFFIGYGTPYEPLVWTAWFVGTIGLALYYVAAFQYLGDARRLVRNAA